MIHNVIKRDSTIEPFDRSKIKKSVTKAYEEVGATEFLEADTESVTQKVEVYLKKEYKDFDKLDIELIQDAIEKTLIEKKLVDVSKAFILYRERRKDARSANSAIVNAVDVMDGYLSESDWRAKENSNVTFSIGGLILHNSGSVTANYWLKKVYPKYIGDAHINADLHIHDISMLAPYCAGHSLRQLIEQGIKGVSGKVASGPAKHLNTLVQQMVNFLGIMQNEWAGAQAFSSFDTYLAPFVKKDNMSAAEVKQCMQTFLYGINTPSRWGTQAPFSNITLDWVCPDDMKEKTPIVGGEKVPFQYKDCQKEMDIINRELLSLYLEGDYEGRGFQYPIPTYNITQNFDWANPNCELLFELTSKYGTPYFQNFVNSDLDPSDVRSMCLTPETRIRVRYKNHQEQDNWVYVDATIENVHRNIPTYQILTPQGWKDIEDEQAFAYKGKMLEFTFADGRKLSTTPGHIFAVQDNHGDLYFTRADKVSLGDKAAVLDASRPVTVADIREFDYKGLVYDVTVAHRQPVYDRTTMNDEHLDPDEEVFAVTFDDGHIELIAKAFLPPTLMVGDYPSDS